MSALDWPLDTSGYLHREATRVLLSDDSGWVLLAKGHDEDQPEQSWWFTIGGGIEEGGDPYDAAVHEASKEIDIELGPDDPVGPVPYQTAEFDFLAVTARQDEWLFIAQIPSAALSWDGWTELKHSVTGTQAWWDTDEAAVQTDGEIYLAQILEYACAWRGGWDGHMIHLTDTREPQRFVLGEVEGSDRQRQT